MTGISPWGKDQEPKSNPLISESIQLQSINHHPVLPLKEQSGVESNRDILLDGKECKSSFGMKITETEASLSYSGISLCSIMVINMSTWGN